MRARFRQSTKTHLLQGLHAGKAVHVVALVDELRGHAVHVLLAPEAVVHNDHLCMRALHSGVQEKVSSELGCTQPATLKQECDEGMPQCLPANDKHHTMYSRNQSLKPWPWK